MKLLFFSFAIFISSCISALAQQKKAGNYPKSDYYTNLKPSDPETASLGAYGKTPINYYTGLPEIALNLLTLDSRDLNQPVSINYDASGVKLNDISSEVGLKWNLSTGGYVARQMNGKPDEHPTLGFWKFENQSIPSNKAQWVSDYEKNVRDFEPDEFILFVNGRSIKFIIKNGVPLTIPKQNVVIRYYLANGKINLFEFISEDGTKYVFGGTANSVAERKIETMSISTNFDYLQSVINQVVLDFNLGGLLFGSKAKLTETTGDEFYNDRWNLVSISSPTGDQITFSYSNIGYQKYVTAPSVTRVDNVVNQLESYTFNGNQSITGIYAYAKFSSDCLSPNYDNDQPTACPTSSPTPINESETEKYFDPLTVFPEPGGAFVSQSLITESVIKLNEVNSSIGNKLVFTSSARPDLAGGIKYDQIDLYNLIGSKIKTINLNYAVVDADVTDDYLWLSEAYMANRITNVKPIDGEILYFAHHFLQYNESDINSQINANNPTDAENANRILKKYAFEGLKEYNFKRLFLENIVETINLNSRQIYTFLYGGDRTKLKRRNSPIQNHYGFGTYYYPTYYPQSPPDPPRIGPPLGENPPDMQGGYYSAIIRAYNPRYYNGMNDVLGIPVLSSITYPTKGKTTFLYNMENNGPRLFSVKDIDENGIAINERILSYLDVAFQPKYTTQSLRNVRDPNSNYFFQIRTTSSYPQNKTFRMSAGVFKTYRSVKVTNGIFDFTSGTVVSNNGYEVFNYSSQSDISNAVDITVENPNTTPIITQAFDVYPFPKVQERDHLRGQLLEHFVYDKGNRLLKYTKNDYLKREFGDPIPPQAMASFFGGSFSFGNGPIKYRSGISVNVFDWLYLDKTTEKVYDQNTPQDLTKTVTTITNYTYDPSTLQMVESKTYNEQVPNSYVTTKTKYVTHPDYSPASFCTQQHNQCMAMCGGNVSCWDTCDTQQYECLNGTNLPAESKAIVALQSKRQINSPIEIQNWIQDGAVAKLTSAVVYRYNLEGSGANQFVKPKEIWGLKQPLDASAFSSSKINSGAFLEIDPKMRKLHSYDSYNSTGNLLQQTSLDGTVFTYQWGFNNSLVTGTTTNPGSLQQQSTFVHQPLVGITQSTDANGRNVNYKYDRLNRLKLIRDHDTNIITRYRYHYKDEMDNAVAFGYQPYYSTNVDNSIQFYTLNTGEPGTTLMWDFGNGIVKENGATTEYQTYTTPGYYTVKLASSHPEYPMAVTSKNIRILSPASATITSPAVTPNTNRTVCGSQTTTCTVSIAGGPYTYQWEYNYSASGNANFLPIGTNSPTLNFNLSGVQASSNTIRCKVSDADGNARYSSYITIFYYCQGQPGPGNCPPGYSWNSTTGQCVPPAGTCDPGCFWNGNQCVCP